MRKLSQTRRGLRAAGGVSGRAGRGGGARGEAPVAAVSFPGRSERDFSPSALPLRRARPLAPSASRWNYYSESDKAQKIDFYTAVRAIPPPRFFPAKPLKSPALFRGRRGARRRRRRPGRGCSGREKRSAGVLAPRPSRYKGLVGGDSRDNLSPSPAAALGTQEGRFWVAGEGGGDSLAARHSSNRM